MSGGRRREALIVDPRTDARSHVGMRVAADFLGVDVRTLRTRINLGKFTGVWRDGKVVKIELAYLVAYKADHFKAA